ncbi:TetR family transcriptional regulator [Nakamurella flavida]|uniref:TetR family transcriptional regulator n=1 Tax=Nakamurella flavida TaxID=363630 RepID=A0A939C4J7_9ACTN|nr:TetR family transcriptional regulator [Nakamurella flavida]MBM9475292.1 TetR family transcriptional regulator [Nakamurella flavida]
MHVVAPGGLREAKKKATREQLTSAARRLTLEHGLDAVTVEMICLEVGVSVRTFHNYFPTKDDALAGDQPTFGDEAAARRFVAGGPTGALLPDLLELMDPSATVQDVDRAELHLAHAVVLREPRVLARQLAHAMAQEDRIAGLIAERRSLPAADAACRTVSAVALAILRRSVTDWVTADDDSPLRPHLDAGLAVAMTELGPDPTASREPSPVCPTTQERP